jgi:transcriptional regulator with XRE-family HTH domain
VGIKQLRERLNLTQAQVAEALGTKRPQISNLERGVAVPDWLIKALVLNRLLAKAGLSYDDLLLSLPDPTETPRAAESPAPYRTD